MFYILFSFFFFFSKSHLNSIALGVGDGFRELTRASEVVQKRKKRKNVRWPGFYQSLGPPCEEKTMGVCVGGGWGAGRLGGSWEAGRKQMCPSR